MVIFAVLYLQPQCHPYRVCMNCAVFYINICCFIAARNYSKPINVNSQAVRRVYQSLGQSLSHWVSHSVTGSVTQSLSAHLVQFDIPQLQLCWEN